MATYVPFDQFFEDVMFGVYNFTSDSTCSITLALSNDAPSASADAVLADLTSEIANYANITSNPTSRIVAISGTPGQTAGTFSIALTDITLTATGTVGPFQYVIHYDDDPTAPADPLIMYYDHGSAVTLAAAETYDIDYGATWFTFASA